MLENIYGLSVTTKMVAEKFFSDIDIVFNCNLSNSNFAEKSFANLFVNFRVLGKVTLQHFSLLGKYRF